MSRRSMIAGAAASVAATGLGAIPALCLGKIYPGAAFGSLDLSGLSPEQGEALLRRRLAAFATHALTFRYGDQTWKAGLADLGFSVDYETMVQSAMAHGRVDGVVDRYTTFVDRDGHAQVALALHEDTETLTAFIERIGDALRIEPTNARLVMEDGAVVVQDHADGRELDVMAARRDALRHLRAGRTATVDLAVQAVEADVRSTDLAGAKDDAWRLVSEPIIFTKDDLAFPIGSDHLTGALSINKSNVASLDPAMLQDRFAQIAQAVASAPKNVMLGWDDGLYVVANDEDGVEADLAAMAEAVTTAATTSERTLPLPLTSVRADARADNVDELGIDAHLAMGSSSFTGSSRERAANVRVSADKVSFKLVGPGETFSFNDLLGPISEDHGFVAGTIISGDWIASDIGGGVCQVSTTVFRAAAEAGFRLSEWNPHSWRLAFYEADGSSPGFDAAIYQPNTEWETEQDLTFENPLGSWLLLMMVIDGDTVRAHFYGRDPAWNVELFPAQVSDPKPMPEPVERVNPALAPGERRMVQQGAPGYVVRLRRRVTAADGAVIADGEFVSDYVSQPEAWEVGPP